ncbi:hypothetical protein D3C71_1041200 [compost metagenome]
MKMTVFQTDVDGLYQYEAVAHELPLSPGKFNVPYGAETAAPPAAPPGMVARWGGKSWELVQDNRHADLWISTNNEPYTVGRDALLEGTVYSYPGWGPLPDWLTHIKPVDAHSKTE